MKDVLINLGVSKKLLSKFEIILAHESAVVTIDPKRDSAIFARLSGLDGNDPDSLRHTAAPYDLSAERVRQISHKISEFVIPSIAVKSEYFDFRADVDAAMELIHKCAPGVIEAISKKLNIVSNNKFLDGDQSAASIVRLAEMLGINGRIRLEDWDGRHAIVDVDMQPCFPLVMSLARKVCGASGSFSASVVADFLQKNHSISLNADAVDSMLAPFSTKVSDGESGEIWYTFENTVNDTVKRAKNRVGDRKSVV